MKSFEELLASKFRFFKLSNFCWVGREGKVCEFLSFFLFFFLSFFSINFLMRILTFSIPNVNILMGKCEFSTQNLNFLMEMLQSINPIRNILMRILRSSPPCLNILMRILTFINPILNILMRILRVALPIVNILWLSSSSWSSGSSSSSSSWSADRLRWKRFSVSHGDSGLTRSCVDSFSNIEIRARDQRESQRRRTKMAMHVLLLAHGKSFRFVAPHISAMSRQWWWICCSLSRSSLGAAGNTCWR